MIGHSPETVLRAPMARQRKTVTVLMTDLCGSTRLGAGMEMELYADILARVRQLWQRAAALHGGTVVRQQGDGAMLLFGHQEAGEHDVVNAVEAALGIHRELGDLGREMLPEGPVLQARSGIHVGVVLIEEGSMERGVYDLIGDVANIAGTLEKNAPPGEILVVRESLRPHEGLFDLEPRFVDTIEQMLGGGRERQRAEPQVPLVASVRGRTSAARRFDAAALRGLTPFIGRRALVEDLRAFLADDAGGARCAVVTAPAGLGKTRLLEELAGSQEFGRWQVLRGGCESYGETELLQPFQQMLRGLAGASRPGDPVFEEASVAQARSSRDVDFLRDRFKAWSAAASLLLVVDDWQWADDASRRLLQSLLDLPHGPRILLTARPHPEGVEWIPGALQFRLEPWSEQQTGHAVRRWMVADPLLIARIHTYSGGVPLFVEELCHSTSAIRLWQQFELRGTPRDAGLKLLVASRLARLPDALVHAVRAASVIGNEVPRALLDEVCGTPVSDAQVVALTDADFLYPDRRPGVLHFKHGITRAAVYEDIGLALRREMHGRARRALEGRLEGEAAHDMLSALAYHCEGAGEHEQAARFAEQAGHEALRAFAMDLARGHYRRAMDALRRAGPATPEREARFCKLACHYGMACIFDPLALGNDVSVFEDAVRRAQAMGATALLAETQYWLAYMLYGAGRFRDAAARAREALALSREAGREALAMQVEAALGEMLVGTCEYDEAVRCIDVAVDAKRRRAAGRGGGLPVGSAYALACKGSVLADRGEFAPAHECFDEAMTLLGPSSHPVGNSVRNWASVAYIWQGDWQRAQAMAADSLRIAENTGALYLVAVARSTLGFARWCESGDPEGLRMLEDAVAWMEARSGRLFTSLHFGWLAEACAAEGRGAQARPLAGHVLQRARQGERLGQAIACRSLAFLAAQEGAAHAADRWLARADRAAAARGSAREQALNALARARIVAGMGGDDGPGAQAAQAALGRLGVRLPARSLLTRGAC